MIAPEACKLRSVAKATRAHSTRAKQAVDGVGDSVTLGFIAAGVVSTLLRARGCKGVIGNEADLRGRVGRADLVASFFGGDRAEFEACDGAFAASPNAFSVALTICVASTAFSFGFKSLRLWHASPLPLTDRFVVVVENFILAEDWVGFRDDLREGLEDSSSWSCLP